MRGLLLLAVMGLGAGAAQADNLVYMGAGITRDNVKDIAATGASFNDTAWKVMAGFRPIKLLAIEADYLNLGSQSRNFVSGSTNLEYKAFGAYAVGFAPIPLPYLDVFGKVGLARWTSSGGTVAPPSSFFSLSGRGTEFAWGVGGQLHVGNVGGRLEYESFNIPNTNGASAVSLSVFLNIF